MGRVSMKDMEMVNQTMDFLKNFVSIDNYEVLCVSRTICESMVLR